MIERLVKNINAEIAMINALSLYCLLDNELTVGGFNMDVGNGSKIHEEHGTCSIRTKIVLTCNSSAVWSNPDLTNIFSFHAEKNNPCEVITI